MIIEILNLPTWDLSKVINMSSMFTNCEQFSTYEKNIDRKRKLIKILKLK